MDSGQIQGVVMRDTSSYLKVDTFSEVVMRKKFSLDLLQLGDT